jgi:Flp pilus assembly protein TadB
MKKISLYVFLVLLFFPAKLYAKTFSWKDYTSNVKKMQITSKNMQALLNEMILKISEDCCEKNFQNKERLLLIKTNMNTCLEEDCHKKNFLFYKKKPQKLLVLEQIEEAKNLLLKNSKLKYENEVQKKKAKRLEEIEAKRLEEIEAKRLEEIEAKRLEEIEAKLEETSIKDQEQTAKDDKKKAYHEAMERERAEKLKKLGITKRKKK